MSAGEFLQLSYKSKSSFVLFFSLYKTSGSLIWSVFGLKSLDDMDSRTGSASRVVFALFLAFLILSVIMLVNMLVALLSNTYDNVKVR